jgi:hypothetical protein
MNIEPNALGGTPFACFNKTIKYHYSASARFYLSCVLYIIIVPLISYGFCRYSWFPYFCFLFEVMNLACTLACIKALFLLNIYKLYVSLFLLLVILFFWGMLLVILELMPHTCIFFLQRKWTIFFACVYLSLCTIYDSDFHYFWLVLLLSFHFDFVNGRVLCCCYSPRAPTFLVTF